MTVTREAVYQALFNKVSSITDFVTAERRLIKPDSVPKEAMPALFQVQVDELSEYEKQIHGTPVKRVFKVDLYIYIHAPDPVYNPSTNIGTTIYPSSIINPILDKLDAILKPDAFPNRTQTLGGLVQYAYVGNIRYYNHPNGTQMMVVAPIEMLVVMP